MNARLSLEEAAGRLGIKERDCRSCKSLAPDPGGLGFGWCRAFDKYVKLYHPAGTFFSQCQFEKLTRVVE